VTCEGCKHFDDDDHCRRFPPVLVERPEYLEGGGKYPATWAFPEALGRCGEFARKPEDDET
jgi:hypothetical protein